MPKLDKKNNQIVVFGSLRREIKESASVGSILDPGRSDSAETNIGISPYLAELLQQLLNFFLFS